MTAARGHRIGVGDLIISRRNDPTVELRNTTDRTGAPHPVRNGNRWRVAGFDPATNRLAAERLDDGARVVFEGDYLREHITHGYASLCTAPKASPPIPPTRSSGRTPRAQRSTWR